MSANADPDFSKRSQRTAASSRVPEHEGAAATTGTPGRSGKPPRPSMKSEDAADRNDTQCCGRVVLAVCASAPSRSLRPRK